MTQPATALPTMPRTAPTTRDGPDFLLGVAVVAVAAALVRAIVFTPIEATQGPAQKIFYVHVPSAFIALYLCFALLAVTSALYLWLREERLDRVAESAAEVGLTFMTVTLLTGPLWGKPIWGTWWTWDARLTLTLFTWLIVLGYLTLRNAIEDRGQRARYSAVLGVLAGLLVPFIHLSVYLFRTLHPQPILLKPSAPSLPPEQLTTFLFSFGAFFLLFVALLRARYRYAVDRDRLAELRGGED
ncbi:cytochrome c biogenesis protein CcsA [Gemmatirosa kalamazoonensis]|nr:cytochrome c biogenesis protein CcsA [Gemmatirosa kalamazoonensis]